MEAKQVVSTSRQSYSLFTKVLIDKSASVLPFMVDKKNGLLPNLVSLLKSIVSPNHAVSVNTFDGTRKTKKVVGYTNNFKFLSDTLMDMEPTSEDPGSTNLYEAISTTLDEIQKRETHDPRADRFNSLIVYTDGTDTSGPIVPFPDLIKKIEETGTRVFVIGVGGEINKDILKSIAKSGFSFIDSHVAIEKAFKEIASNIEDELSQIYMLSYCTTKRYGQHAVKITLPGAINEINFNVTGKPENAECYHTLHQAYASVNPNTLVGILKETPDPTDPTIVKVEYPGSPAPKPRAPKVKSNNFYTPTVANTSFWSTGSFWIVVILTILIGFALITLLGRRTHTVTTGSVPATPHRSIRPSPLKKGSNFETD